MKKTTSWAACFHLIVAAFCFGALGVGYYLQTVLEMAPCPMCILQRYLFLAIGITSTVASFYGSRIQRKGAIVDIVLTFAGLVAAGWLLWVRAHPSVSCGVDKLQVVLNKLPTADLFPSLFMSEGLCSGEWAPVLGLSVPTWSFLGFAVLMVFLMVMPRSSNRL